MPLRALIDSDSQRTLAVQLFANSVLMPLRALIDSDRGFVSSIF